MLRNTCCAVALLLATVTTVNAAAVDSLKQGTPELKSMGALAFGPEGIIFIADTRDASIFAIATEDTKASDAKEGLKIANVNEKIASLLGIESDQLKINDLTVNPLSTNLYLSVQRGTKPDSPSVLLMINRKGEVSEVSLKSVKFAKVALPNASDKQRQEAITCLAFLSGKLYVAGLSNEEFASNLRAIPFPFKDTDKGSSIEIFHGAHGAWETKSPVRTFVPYEIKGEPNLLAAYQCTPLVKLPVKDLEPGKKVKGTTVAELGNGNRPLDMVIYQKGGKDFILMSNTKHGLLKIPTEGIDTVDPITAKTGPKGLKAENIKSAEPVVQLAKLNDKQAVVLTTAGKAINLDTIELP
jgi:hypothetical protein